MSSPSNSDETTPLLSEINEETKLNGTVKGQEVNDTNHINNSIKLNHEEEQQNSDKMVATLSRSFIFGYSLGHVGNDLCSSIWFSYMLLFLSNIIQLGAATAGILMLIGQFADAIATAFVGWTIDKRLCTKNNHHLIGCITVCVSFPMMFFTYPSYPVYSWAAFAWYAFFIILFQVGWAFVQISHLSMIPKYGKNKEDRHTLTTVRIMTQIISGVLAFAIVWAAIHCTYRMTPMLNSDDRHMFTTVSVIIAALGFASFAGFRYFTDQRKRPRPGPPAQLRRTNSAPQSGEDQPADGSVLIHVTILSVVAKVYSALSSVYMPLWIDEREKVAREITYQSLADLTEDEIRIGIVKGGGGAEDIAMVPLVISLASLLGTCFVMLNPRYLRNLALYMAGIFVCTIGALFVFFVEPTMSPNYLYYIALLIGFGSSFTIAATSSMTTEIAKDTADRRGITYSIVSLSDKIIVGCLVAFSETYKCKHWELCPYYYQETLFTIAFAAACIGSVTAGVLRYRTDRFS